MPEAVSWVGLLVGMYFKYLGTPAHRDRREGVRAGPRRVFIAFVVAALLAGIALKWAAATWLLALLASIVPLGSVIFLIWADRTGRMGARARAAAGRLAATGPAGTRNDVTDL